MNSKLLAASLTLVCTLTTSIVHTQIVRLYGTQANETFTKIIPHGSEYYALGQQTPAGSATPHATISRLDASGNLIWTRRLDIPSQWNDAVLTPSGNLFVVGHTLPFDANSESLMGVIMPTNPFLWVRRYNVTGRESFTRIVRNPVPDNANFPYYVLGLQFKPGGTLWDEVVLITTNDQGNWGWKKIYLGPGAAEDDEFVRDLEVFSNGDLLLAGNKSTIGAVFRANNTGAIVNNIALDPALSSTFQDVAISGNSIFAVGNITPTVSVRLVKFNASFVPQWQVSIPLLTAVRQVWTSGSSIYVVGSATVSGINRGVVLKYQDGTSAPTFQWMKYLFLNETAFNEGTAWLLSASQMAFTDGRTRPNGLGGSDAFFATSDLEMNTCITQTATAATSASTHTFVARQNPDIRIVDIVPGTTVANSLITWQLLSACPPCEANFNFSINCRAVTFTDASLFSPPVTWQWSFPGGTPATSTLQNPPVVTYPTCGTFQVCLTITGAGCTNQICKNVTITDNTPPTITCPPNIAVQCVADTSTTITGVATATDNCPPPLTIAFSSTLTGVLPCDASLRRTWRATDACGNTSTCVQTITIRDTIRPQAICRQGITLTLNANCTATLTPAMVDGGSTDNCGIAGMTVNPSTFTQCGTFPVTLTVRDSCGNTATCTTSVVVTDNILPSIVCPPNLTVACVADTSTTITGVATATDNCNPPPTLSFTSILTGSLPCDATLRRTWKATDACGNMNTCVQSISIRDTVPPSIVCPPNLTVACVADTSTTITGVATATDNCNPPPTLSFTSILTGSLPCNATLRRTWKATDACGNMSTCVQSISIRDTVPPSIVCPPNSTVFTLPGKCYYSGPIPQPTATDNCPPPPTIVCQWFNGTNFVPITPATQFPKGVHTIRCYAEDRCGNRSLTCSYTLTVVDNEPPVITCPPNLIVQGQIDATGQCKATVQNIGAIANDNCPMWSVSWTMTGATTGSGSGNASGTMFMAGVTTVTYTVTDMAGNSVACSFTVTVVCDQPPFRRLCGQAAVTCFSGFNNPVNPSSGVNLNGPVAAVYDVRNHAAAPTGTWWNTVNKIMHPNWTAANLGQVFGIAIAPNQEIFVTASTVYTCSQSAYPNPFGPAGGGGVYRLNPLTGAVQTFVQTGPFVPGGNAIPNTGSGLGNICHDPTNNQFFVTNMSDGMIYRVQNTPAGFGIVLDRFDPFGQTNPPASGQGANPNFVALGERTWGVAYYNGRVYFSRWREDIGRRSTSAANEIWSIGLSGTGGFASSNNAGGTFWGGETMAVNMASYPYPLPGVAFSNPISDIEFSHTGKMLIAERTMSADCGGAFTLNQWNNWAHSSRVLEFQQIGSTWQLTPGHTTPISASNTNLKFQIGDNAQANSAGGVDYGYESFINLGTVPPAPCDSIVWGTGDNLHPPTSPITWVYGMQGIRSSGQDNNPPLPHDHQASILIDFDNDVQTHDKILIGDVDVLKCGCPPTEPPPPCDSLWVVKHPLTPDPGLPVDSCCWSVDLHVHHGPVGYIEAEIITPGVTFSNASTSSNFTFIPLTTPTLLTIKHNPFQAIPQGVYPNALQFCLNNITNTSQVPQVVVFRWYVKGPNDVPYLACTDTCYFECRPPVMSRDTCLAIKNDTIICDPNNPNEFTYFFQVQNLSNFTANQVILSNPPAGFAFRPCPPPSILSTSTTIALPNPALVPGIAPDSCSPMLCVKIVSSAPVLTPTLFTFQASLSSVDTCCHAPEPFSVWLRPCCNPCERKSVVVRPRPPVDSCCHTLDIINPCGGNYFTKLELALLTPGVNFGSHYTGGSSPSTWSNPVSTANLIQWQHLSGYVPSGTLNGLINFCLDDINQPSEVPQVVVLRWITQGANGRDSVACTDTLRFDCPMIVDHGCVEVIEDRIRCVKDNAGNVHYQYTLTFLNTSTPPHFATELIFTQIGGPPVAVFPNPVNFFPPGLPWNGIQTITTDIYPLSGPLPVGTKLVFAIRLRDAISGDNWCCFEADTLCIFIPPCDSCLCAHDPVLLTQGGLAYTLPCNSRGPLTVLNCPATNITLSGFLGCKDAQTDELCDETVVQWELTRPNNLPSLFGTTTNYSTLTFPASAVSTPGQYCLTRWTICPGTTDTCVCRVCWLQPSCDTCCADFEAFCQRVENAVSLSLQPNQCKVTLNVGTLPNCDYLEWVDWGDGSPIQYGTFGSNAMLMHTYSGSGTYVISYLAIEINPATGLICFEKILRDTIQLQCGITCSCGGFSNLFVRDKKPGGINIPVTCNNNTPVVLPCRPGQGYYLTGAFHCAGASCPPTHQINWTLSGPGGSHSGSFIDNDPFFGIHLLPSYFNQPGLYTLVLSGNCGSDICRCIIRFVVDCPPLCPCTPQIIQNLAAAVSQGFAVSTSNTQCKACFSPLALSDCEQVRWHINSITSPSIGQTWGNQTFCHTFSGSGTYTIIMVVTRLKPDGSLCEVFTYSKVIHLNCLNVVSECLGSLLPNAGFNVNPVAGSLRSGSGFAPGWRIVEHSGDPHELYLLEYGSSQDGWVMVPTGTYTGAGILGTVEPLCLARNDTGTVTLRLRTPGDPIPGVSVKMGRKPPGGAATIVLYTGNNSVWPNCQGGGCYTLANLEDLFPFDDDSWYDLQIPYDLRRWAASDSCAGGRGVPARLAVYMSYPLSMDQGLTDLPGFLIDDICLRGQVVGVREAPLPKPLRLYPNPTAGSVTVEWPAPSTGPALLRITSPTGQVLQQQPAEAGTRWHELDLRALPAGLYFVEVWSEGRIAGIGRIVRQ